MGGKLGGRKRGRVGGSAILLDLCCWEGGEEWKGGGAEGGSGSYSIFVAGV